MTQTRYIDLTGGMENGMWEYGKPYPPVQITQVCSLKDRSSYADYKVNAHKISFSTSSATYVQTSAEMFEGRATIDQIPLERLVLQVSLVRIPREARGVVGVAELEQARPDIRPGEGLIVQTGWERCWNQKIAEC